MKSNRNILSHKNIWKINFKITNFLISTINSLFWLFYKKLDKYNEFSSKFGQDLIKEPKQIGSDLYPKLSSIYRYKIFVTELIQNKKKQILNQIKNYKYLDGSKYLRPE